MSKPRMTEKDNAETPKEQASAKETTPAEETGRDAAAEPASPWAQQRPEDEAGAGDSSAAESRENTDPETRVGELESQVAVLAESLDKWKRAAADAVNAQRRAEAEAEKARKYSLTNFARDALAVADNLQRALLAAPPEAREQDELLKNLALGVEMTGQELQNVLVRHGITRIEAEGRPFDPNYHQAMQEVEDTSKPAGTVVQVFQDGYMIHERLLRPAMVVVSKGGPKPEPDKDGEGKDQTRGPGPEQRSQGVDTSV